MLSYDKAKKKPSVPRSLTGFDRSEFENLIPEFEKAWNGYVGETYIKNKHRKRKYGGGRKPKLLTAENRLLFILFYFRIYPLQTVIAFFSGMSQSQADERIYKLSTVLRMAMEEQCRLPGHDPHSLEEVSAECPELPFIIDGTERRRQRPGNEADQKAFYSGKKKCHTVKNNLTVNTESRTVCYLSRTYEGKNMIKESVMRKSIPSLTAAFCSEIQVIRVMNPEISSHISILKNLVEKSLLSQIKFSAG